MILALFWRGGCLLARAAAVRASMVAAGERAGQRGGGQRSGGAGEHGGGWQARGQQGKRWGRRRASERAAAAGKPSQAPQLDRNDSFLPNSEIAVSSCIDSRDDFVSSRRNDFFYFSSLSSLIRLPRQYFVELASHLIEIETTINSPLGVP